MLPTGGGKTILGSSSTLGSPCSNVSLSFGFCPSFRDSWSLMLSCVYLGSFLAGLHRVVGPRAAHTRFRPSTLRLFSFSEYLLLNSFLLLPPPLQHCKTSNCPVPFFTCILHEKPSLSSSQHLPPDRVPHILTQDFPPGLPLSGVSYIKCPSINCFLPAACNTLCFPTT